MRGAKGAPMSSCPDGGRPPPAGEPPEQERVDVLHEGAERRADVVVPVRARPAPVGEATVAVLVGTARRLDDAVEGDELVNDQCTHGLLSFAAFNLATNERPAVRLSFFSADFAELT